MQYLVLSVSAYRYAKKGTNETVEGLKVHYYSDNTLDPRGTMTPDGLGERGIEPMSVTLPIRLLSKIKEVPGLYEVIEESTPTRVQIYGQYQTVPISEIKDLTFVSTVKLTLDRPKPT